MRISIKRLISDNLNGVVSDSVAVCYKRFEGGVSHRWRLCSTNGEKQKARSKGINLKVRERTKFALRS